MSRSLFLEVLREMVESERSAYGSSTRKYRTECSGCTYVVVILSTVTARNKSCNYVVTAPASSRGSFRHKDVAQAGKALPSVGKVALLEEVLL